jgi:hypothetical protein
MSDPSADMPAAVRNTQADRSLLFSDLQDFDDADRGFIAALEPGIVRNSDGYVVWDSDSYAFLDDDCPPTVNPSLWRQSRLCARQGLFEVTDRIYQVRGLDLSNMTLVEGDTGVIVIDPLISAETAAAGLALYRAHRGDRPVTGVIYTHSHIDHFGGVKGVTTVEDVAAGRCPVLAPAGFVEHAVAENVYAGTAMGRRAAYMYGAALPRGPRGAVGAGLGPTTSTGTPTLIAPTIDIEHTGQTETVDGVEVEYQMTPGTEAPAEMNFYFPRLRALCMAENATHTLHDLLTLRGALVRDPHVWSQYLTESVNRFAYRSDHHPDPIAARRGAARRCRPDAARGGRQHHRRRDGRRVRDAGERAGRTRSGLRDRHPLTFPHSESTRSMFAPTVWTTCRVGSQGRTASTAASSSSRGGCSAGPSTETTTVVPCQSTPVTSVPGVPSSHCVACAEICRAHNDAIELTTIGTATTTRATASTAYACLHRDRTVSAASRE